jgi:hypothetical protein
MFSWVRTKKRSKKRKRPDRYAVACGALASRKEPSTVEQKLFTHVRTAQ